MSVPAWILATALAVALSVVAAPPAVRAQPAPQDARAQSPRPDAYVRGYADAILGDLFQVRDYGVVVRGDTIEVSFTAGQPQGGADKIARALLQIPGIRRVVVVDGDTVVADERRDGDVPVEEIDGGWDVFPRRELFQPLVADPRWPHFSASYQWYIDSDELTHVAAVSFGETFAFIRSPATDVGEFELGMLAGVFSVFDLASESFDLVNSDFLVGPTLTHRYAALATQLRFYHQSSHLGDEYLLRNRVDRVNLSYEAFDVLLSYTIGWVRGYAGGGLLVHRNPELERGLAQVGVDLTSPVAFRSGHLRPIGGVDVQFRQESDWEPDLSTRVGLQVEHPTLERLRLQLLAEYYRGFSPVGQFYQRRIETLGVGLHLGF